MAEEAAGAPLRAFGTIISIWVMMRVFSWNIPPDIVVDSVGPAIGHSAIGYEISQINNAGAQRRSGSQFSRRVSAQDTAGENKAFFPPFYPPRGSIDRMSADRLISRPHFLLANMRAADVNYRLPAGISPQQAPSLSQRVELNKPPGQNLTAKLRRNGLIGYAWVFARRVFQSADPESRGQDFIISIGQYGGSQAGVILSYPILAKPNPEIAVYGRLTTALAPLAQEEAAVGLRMHPVQNLPFSIHAEKRLDAGSGGDRGTAFYMAGGTGPDQIVEDILLETYAQAGYILGDNESYFFDGAATLQHPVAESGRKKLYFGVGAWAGGERQIARLDVGPRADIRIPLGSASARFSVDWRFRIAGNARPENGLALTVSTGF